MVEIIEYVKKKKWYIICAVIITWLFLSCSVYKSLDITLSLRSTFMKEVVVKITAAIITFVGVAYTVELTVRNNQLTELSKVKAEIDKNIVFERLKKNERVNEVIQDHSSFVLESFSLMATAYFGKNDPDYSSIIPRIEDLLGKMIVAENMIIMYLESEDMYIEGIEEHDLLSIFNKLYSSVSHCKSLHSQLHLGILNKNFEKDGVKESSEKILNQMSNLIKTASKITKLQWNISIKRLENIREDLSNQIQEGKY